MDEQRKALQELADSLEADANDPNTTIIGDPDDIYRDIAADIRLALTKPVVLGSCMYCSKPVRLGEQWDKHFAHTTCEAIERVYCGRGADQ